MTAKRTYVAVVATFDAEGQMMPKEIIWEDGRKFSIDRVTDVRQAPAIRSGGQGERYTIHVLGRESYLFFERSVAKTGSHIGKWFVEPKRVVLQ